MTERKKVNQKEVMHMQEVVAVAYLYNTTTAITLQYLASIFSVSQNTITSWLLEAIEKGYVRENKICERIKEKHIYEYETNFHIQNSGLRTAYEEAFRKRVIPTEELVIF